MRQRARPLRLLAVLLLPIALLVATRGLTVDEGRTVLPPGTVAPSASLATARTSAVLRPTASAAAAAGLHAVGNQLHDGAGRPIRLLGINRAGTEYACIQGWNIFDGPSDAASVQAIAAWKANAVRVPLNEHCWLGVGTDPAYGAAAYQRAIRDYVSQLTSHGLVVILDLHWAAPRGQKADRLRPMPDRDYAPEFWRQVAGTFKDNGAVIFDLFNEPYPDSNRDTPEAWRCWRDGGTCAGVSFEAAGMQELVSAVRSTGAANAIMLSGIQYGAGLSRWLEYQPVDPENNLIASWHMYPHSSYANNPRYWDTYVAQVAQNVPLVAGEIGQTDCGADFLLRIMAWLDQHGAGYNAWAWTLGFGCEALVTDYAGTPTAPYGQAYKDHLARLASVGGHGVPTGGGRTTP